MAFFQNLAITIPEWYKPLSLSFAEIITVLPYIANYIYIYKNVGWWFQPL